MRLCDLLIMLPPASLLIGLIVELELSKPSNEEDLKSAPFEEPSNATLLSVGEFEQVEASECSLLRSTLSNLPAP